MGIRTRISPNEVQKRSSPRTSKEEDHRPLLGGDRDPPAMRYPPPSDHDDSKHKKSVVGCYPKRSTGFFLVLLLGTLVWQQLGLRGSMAPVVRPETRSKDTTTAVVNDTGDTSSIVSSWRKSMESSSRSEDEDESEESDSEESETETETESWTTTATENPSDETKETTDGKNASKEESESKKEASKKEASKEEEAKEEESDDSEETHTQAPEAEAEEKPPETITEFDDHCRIVWESEYPFPSRDRTYGYARNWDHQRVGPCFAKYSQRIRPPGGFTKGVDWFHDRDYHFPHAWREDCYEFCLNKVHEFAASGNALDDQDKVVDRTGEKRTPQKAASSWLDDGAMLIEAAIMGMPKIVKLLATDARFGPMDPLEYSRHKFGYVSIGHFGSEKPKKREFGSDPTDTTVDVGINAIQYALIGGHAEIVAVLLDAIEARNGGRNLRKETPNLDVVVDNAGRTVRDYITLKGSPIRPRDAKQWLGLDTTPSQTSRGILHPDGTELSLDDQAALDDANPFQDDGLGWFEDTPNHPTSPRCDMDVIYGSMSRERFYKDYFLTGRPFVVRGIVPEEEVANFRKARWAETERFHPDTKCKVGPTAYPSITGQDTCEERFSIEEISRGKQCPELPGIPMVHARHPSDQEFQELFPQYDGDPYVKTSGWRKLMHWFRNDLDDSPGWQVFFGGDGSGATLHWHHAAMNALYVGRKDWKITPPRYRGYSGMPAVEVAKKVDDAVGLSCTQGPGDLFYIPNYWGHLTINQGFAIGAATILPLELQQEATTKPNIFFVHVNKAGGTSMMRMLNSQCEDQFLNEHWGEDPSQRTFHTTAHALIDRHGRDMWEISYNFALVRHPLARQVSNYWFLIDQCQEEARSACVERDIPVGLDVTKLSEAEKIASFHEYLHKLYDKHPPGSKEHYLFGSKGHGNEKFPTFNATQTSWMVNADGMLVVDHVYKLEELSEHLEKLAQDLPCLGENTPQKRRRLYETIMAQAELEEEHGVYHDDENDEAFGDFEVPRRRLLEMKKKNVTPKYPNYKLFGKNERTNQILREVFAVDYENFGYEYDEDI